MLPALHPATVHFPIALLLISSLFTWLARNPRRERFELSGYHCLIAGLIGAVVAIAAGLADIARLLNGPSAEQANAQIGAVNAHAAATIGATLVYWRAWLLRRRERGLPSAPEIQRRYLQLHAVGAALLVIGGGLGGRLVYSLNLGVGL